MTANAAIAVGEADLGGEWVVRGDERETTGADE